MRTFIAGITAFGVMYAFALTGAGQSEASNDRDARNARDGRAIFRYDTFGDEQLWTRVLRMNEPLSTLPPATALAVGLKVDVNALPESVRAALAAGKVDLNDPAVT